MKKEELGELIIASEDMMYHVAKTLLYRDADCADAIQETIVKAFSKLHTLKSDVYAKTWLTRILINECYTVMRKEKKVVSLEDYQMEERAAETKDYSELYERSAVCQRMRAFCHTVLHGGVQCAGDSGDLRCDRERRKEPSVACEGETEKRIGTGKQLRNGELSMNIENMEQEFPKMPQSMRDMIEKEVEKQVKVTPQRGYFP